MLIIFDKYTAPAMDEIEAAAHADCHCGCLLLDGSGSGFDSPSEEQEQLDDQDQELRKWFEYLYNQKIPKQPAGENIPKQAVSQGVYTAPAMRQEQKNKLLLAEPTFSERDIKILQSILEGKKYEYIARKNNLCLSSVKKRVSFLYKRLGTVNRASFVNTYNGYTIELAADAEG